MVANRSSWIFAALLTLAACGGGSSFEDDGGGGGGGTDEEAGLQLSVAAFNCPSTVPAGSVEGCTVTEQITPTQPGRLQIRLSVVSGQFSVASRPIVVTAEKGILSPLNGQVVTNASGYAYLNLSAGTELEVTDNILASYQQTVDGNDYSLSAQTSVRYVQTPVNSLDMDLTTTWDLATPLPDGSSIPLNAQVQINGVAPVSPVQVIFSSRCSANEEAVIDSPVITGTSGKATSSYKSTGCAGQDIVQATVTAGGLNVIKTLTIEIKEEPAGAIEFVEANRSYLCLDGTGCPSSSILTFKVVDAQGNAKRNAEVDFELVFNSDVARDTPGLAYISSQPTGLTNTDGLVTVTITAGALPVSPRVQATTIVTPDVGAAYPITAVSSQIGIGTGLPHINGFSLAFDKFNIEGGSTDGVTSTLSLRLSDHFGNPVPNGTSVTVISPETGLVGQNSQANCVTANGKCTVVWESSGTRPDDYRATVLAYATGEESFTDRNGNGLYEPTDTLERQVSEPFVDANENGIYDNAGVYGEQLIDDDQNGVFTPVNAVYDGMLCNRNNDGVGCNRKQVQVSGAGVIALSDNVVLAVCADNSCTSFATGSRPALTTAVASVCVFSVAPDGKTWNPAPLGTAVTFKAEDPLKITGRSSFTQRNTSAPIQVLPGAISPAKTLASTGCWPGRQSAVLTGSGLLTVEVSSGGGEYSAVSIDITAP